MKSIRKVASIVSRVAVFESLTDSSATGRRRSSASRRGRGTRTIAAC
jgi:hypothetical protein